MPIFKYTVASKEGKKLSGTAEAPDEITARSELNNLGFSILALQETTEIPEIDASLTRFAFEGIDKNGKAISGTLPAVNEQDAFTKLQTEYYLTVTTLWEEGSTAEQIATAREKGIGDLQAQLKPDQKKEIEETVKKSIKQGEKEKFVKEKIDYILKEVNKLLKTYDNILDPDKKAEINRQINKLLRIKHSTNLDYILTTAHELLEFIQTEERTLQDKGYKEKRFDFKIKTKKLLDELKKGAKKKTLGEDITERIQKWQKTNTAQKSGVSKVKKFINNVLVSIREFFETPMEILTIKDQIKAYNKQLVEFAQLYFKEPTPEYKAKVKNSLKTIWKTRKKAKLELKEVKLSIKKRKKGGKIEKVKNQSFLSFIDEINSLTGWLLAFYISYYFVSLYLNTKDFGLATIPKGFLVYESQIFKYILVIIFLLHSSTTLKVNFFRKSLVADIVLPIVFIFGSILILLNF